MVGSGAGLNVPIGGWQVWLSQAQQEGRAGVGSEKVSVYLKNLQTAQQAGAFSVYGRCAKPGKFSVLSSVQTALPGAELSRESFNRCLRPGNNHQVEPGFVAR